MPVVMCFGDSNTHGTMPMAALEDRGRHARSARWPGVMAAALGPDWDVIEEGHPGRTTVHADPIEGEHRSGLRILPALLETHRPLDAVVIMLGTNDLKHRFSLTPFDIAGGVERLVHTIRQSDAGPDGTAPKVLVVAPVPIIETGVLGEMFTGGAAKSLRLATCLAEMAARTGVALADAGAWAHVDPDEGIHLGTDAHAAIGQGVAQALKNVI